MNDTDFDKLKTIQEEAFKSGRITSEENDQLKIINNKIYRLASVENPTVDEANQLTELLTQSGDIVLNTNLENSKPRLIGPKFYVISVLILILICVVLLKKFSS